MSPKLIGYGFMPGYTCWSNHGESLSNRSTSSFNIDNEKEDNNEEYMDHENATLNDDNGNFNDMYNDLETNIGDDEYEKLRKLLEDEEKPLYVGCKKYSKLRDVLRLSTLKSTHGWSDKSFTDLLVLLNDMLPEGNELPLSLYQARKMMCPMGLEVERIHACPNDCMLYRNEFKNDHTCFNCGASRYKRKSETDEVDDDVTKNGPPAKVLWYLPIIPRLKQIFANEKESKLLRWHSDDRINDGKLRHVPDSPQWRTIDYMYPEFGNEIRNIRFGLSSDGINPFGNMSSCHSPKQPGNNIDVYLSPLIDDLKTLWSPGYSTKGRLACPICEYDTSSIWLSNCRKTVYMGDRRFLPKNHDYPNKTVQFDGKIEHGKVREEFDAFSRVRNLNVVLGKKPQGKKQRGKNSS
ncbi:uncharacterized protein LOC110869833 [Helianthus annuus]|uniref:uncharacterized protein LOC110869833 n=1 Tax=Helianthus annuus TaxID=4232 RepID=UPI000B8FBD8A|nr:uncharacterized protein LOC110869833 [Helianthus annuus]